MAMSTADSMVSATAKLTGSANFSVWKVRVKNVHYEEDLGELEEPTTVVVNGADDGEVVQNPPRTVATAILAPQSRLHALRE